MTGREVIVQALREKCLHKIITEKYKSEGIIFWTMFKYLEKCFVDDGLKAKSLEDCYDWKTVIIDGNEEVNNLNACVDNSFKNKDIEADNSILFDDRDWAVAAGLTLHPSIVINGRIYYGDVTGQKLAHAICRAYQEAPDECELSWKINVMKNGIIEDFDKMKLPELKEDFFKTEADASKSQMMVNKQVVEPVKKTKVQPIRKYDRNTILFAIGVIIVINVLMFAICKRRMKKQQEAQINLQVQTAVSQYFALSGTEV